MKILYIILLTFAIQSAQAFTAKDAKTLANISNLTTEAENDAEICKLNILKDVRKKATKGYSILFLIMNDRDSCSWGNVPELVSKKLEKMGYSTHLVEAGINGNKWTRILTVGW